MSSVRSNSSLGLPKSLGFPEHTVLSWLFCRMVGSSSSELPEAGVGVPRIFACPTLSAERLLMSLKLTCMECCGELVTMVALIY